MNSRYLLLLLVQIVVALENSRMKPGFSRTLLHNIAGKFPLKARGDYNFSSRTTFVDIVVIFRPRSRNTAFFYPLQEWLTPEVELLTAFQDFETRSGLSDSSDCYGNISAIITEKKCINSIIKVYSLKRSHIKTLMEAARSCVLLHGVYELWAVGGDVDEALGRLAQHIHEAQPLHSAEKNKRKYSPQKYTTDTESGSAISARLNIAVGKFDNPWMDKSVIDEYVGKVKLCISDSSKSEDWISGLTTEDTSKPLQVRLFITAPEYTVDIFRTELSRARASSPFDCFEPSAILCLELVRGIAAPLRSGQGGREPLPLSNALRRPSSGVLRHFSLRHLSFRTPTAMEPELGLLMSSLAGLAPKHSIPPSGSTRTYDANAQFSSKSVISSSSGVAGQVESREAVTEQFLSADDDSGRQRRPVHVLDPFCGSCSLLLAAAVHTSLITSDVFIAGNHSTTTEITINNGIYNATYEKNAPTPIQLIGIDANRDALDITRIWENFQIMNVESAMPVLYHGLADSLLLSSAADISQALIKLQLLPEQCCEDNAKPAVTAAKLKTAEFDLKGMDEIIQFDAIITDPPYGILEQAREHTHNNAISTARKKATGQLQFDRETLRTLLRIADQRLRPGGKLVCFVPIRLNHNRASDTMGATTAQQDKAGQHQDFPMPKQQKRQRWSGLYAEDSGSVDDHFKSSVLVPLLPSSLKLQSCQRQRFSRSFSRYLCVFSKSSS